MSSSSAEVANSTSSSSGNEAKNGNAPQGTETKSNEKLQGEKRSHDNSGNFKSSLEIKKWLKVKISRKISTKITYCCKSGHFWRKNSNI